MKMVTSENKMKIMNEEMNNNEEEKGKWKMKMKKEEVIRI